MEIADLEDLHARDAVIAAVNALIGTFLKKASRADIDLLADVALDETGLLMFRDGTGMPIAVRVAFGKHLDVAATAKMAANAPATLVQPGFEISKPVEEARRDKSD